MDISSQVPNLKPGTMVPKRQKIEIDFPVNAAGSPSDLRGLLTSVIAAENAQAPFAYRLDMDSTGFFLVPTRTRDAEGKSVEITPLLDRLVHHPDGLPGGSRKR